MEDDHIILQTLIAPDCYTTVVTRGTVTREAIRRLILFLELSLETYPTEREVKKAQRRGLLDKS